MKLVKKHRRGILLSMEKISSGMQSALAVFWLSLGMRIFSITLRSGSWRKQTSLTRMLTSDVSQIEEEQKLIRSFLPKVTARSFSLEFAQPLCERFILVFTTFLEVLLNLQQAAVKLFK